MMYQFVSTIYVVTTWLIPVILAVTFHEAAHAFAARHLGDDTASRLGRVSLNPIRHIDPFGTFLFGYAKPVPVNFSALRHPRRDMVLVAAAGPAMNLVLATVAALCLHVADYAPSDAVSWVRLNLDNAVDLNVVLAVFNLLPLPPLDGGRIMVGVLPNVLAIPLARLEPYGMLILIALLLLLPLLGDHLGVDLNVVWHAVSAAKDTVTEAILRLTGNS
jgi:Zn-dependent protease